METAESKGVKKERSTAKIPLKRLVNWFCWSVSVKWPIKKYMYFVEYNCKTGEVRRRRGWKFGPFKISGPFYS